MKITKILEKNESGVSFEFFPPKRESSKKSLALTVKTLMRYKPLYASMTCGAGGGTTQENTRAAVEMLRNEKNLLVMPHITCMGAKKEEIKELLSEYKKEGLENIMALRGDLSSESPKSDSLGACLSYARDLVRLVKDAGNFCIGVAVYPEGHIETSALEEDAQYTKEKIDAGADFAVTQMFFDNAYYYKYLDRMKKHGVEIPTLPGILPLTNIDKVKELASVCRTIIPKDIEEKLVSLSKRPEEMKKVGIDFTIKQCKDLMKNGFKKIHFFTLNQPETMKAILEAIS